MARPSSLRSNPAWIDNILKRVEMEFGISRSSPMFYCGLLVAAALNKSTVDKKLEIFRSYGWSDSEISTMLQKLPQPLTLSEVRLKKVLNFLMKELGYGSQYLAFRPVILIYSLEKKIIPRSGVLKILEENELRACSLFTAIVMSESKFLGDYVLPYKNKLPDITAGFSFAQILGVPGGKVDGSKQRQLFIFFSNHKCNLRSSTGFNYFITAKVQAGETAANWTGNHLLVDCSTDSLNSSRDDAISAVAKLSSLSSHKSQANAVLVVDYLERIGMDQAHINAAVSKFPKLLLYDPDKKLHPKIQCLEEFGLSGRAAGSNKNAVKALKRSGRLLSYSSLQNYGS
nr:transcription termination factor MTERF15, mitochondrial-like [Ipomoea batatas]